MAAPPPTVGDLMTARVITLPPDAPVSTALGLMRSKSVHEIPVLRGKTLVGMITFETIARRASLPLQTKVEHLLLLPPLLTPATTFSEAAEQLIASGLRAAPVLGAKGQLVGILSRTDLVRALPGLAGASAHRIEEIAIAPPAIVRETDPVASLFAQIRQLEEHPFPVVDRKGRLVGAVGVADLGRVLWRPATGGKRDGFARGSARTVEIGSVMHSPAVTVEKGTTVGQAARQMSAEKVSSVIVVEDGRPTGVVAQADLLGLALGTEVRGAKATRDVYVQVTGMRGTGDPELLAEIDRVIAKGLRHISRHVKPILLNLHVSPQGNHRTGDSIVQARLHTERGIFYASSTGWNFFAGVAALMDELESQVRRTREEAGRGVHSRRRARPTDDSVGDPDLEARMRAASGRDEE